MNEGLRQLILEQVAPHRYDTVHDLLTLMWEEAYAKGLEDGKKENE